MKKNLLTLGLFLLIFLSAEAQFNTPQPSPGAKLTQTVGLTEFTIEYSRPGIKGRTVYGDLVPFDKVWRTGANLATKISFNKDIKFGGQDVKAGTYAVLTIPGKSEWKMHLYTYESAGFGAYVDKTPDAVATGKVQSVNAKFESFLIDLNNLRNASADLVVLWENTLVTFPIEVGTKKEVMTQIENLERSTKMTTANNYYGAASFLYEEKENLEKALSYINEAVNIRPEAFWMIRMQSLIYAEMGQKKEAIAAAEKSLAAAEKAGNADYIKMNKESIAEWKKKK